MKNLEVARILYDLADILEMMEIEWKPVAYRKAARNIEDMPENIEIIYNKKGLEGLNKIPGVGSGISGKIAEFLEKGKIKELEKLKRKIPKGLIEIMNIQGVGPKKSWRLYKKLGIKSVTELEKAAKQGDISKLKGFGDKSEEDILLGISLLKKSDRMLIGIAMPIAEKLVDNLNKLRNVEAIIGGSIRRWKEVVKDIDILVVSNKNKEVMDVFTKNVKNVLSKGNTKSSVILKEGINCDLRIVSRRSYGAALNYFTGSKDHNIQLRKMALKNGWKLSEYGLFKNKKYIGGRSENELYKKLGMSYIPPELRENTGEIEAALEGKLPKLVDSVVGDLHVHTNWTDGVNTTKEMVDGARKLGYEYIAVTEHSKSTRIAGGLDVNKLWKRLKEVDKIKDLKIFKGSEVDILKDGKLDYSRGTLKKLDFVIGSVHSGFKMSERDMTKRMVRAIESGYLNLIAHPTGRLINQRYAYKIDLDKIFEAASRNNVAMEINANPSRLDLNEVLIKKASNFGVKFVINTDAHSVDQLKFMRYGIGQARRGWLTEKDVLNCLKLKEFEKMLNKFSSR